MAYGVTPQMIDTYGEIIFKLSLNKQVRRGDAVREMNFEEIEKQRDGTGLTDEEIAERIGLLPEQVSVVRVFVERKHHRIDQHRRLFHLGGGKRWKADEYQHPAERLKFREDSMTLREALNFDPGQAAQYLEKGYWGNDTLSSQLATHAAERPDAPALVTADSQITWAQFKDQVDRLAKGLLGLGVLKGDVVAVQLPNIPAFLLAHQAIAAVGAVMQTVHMPYGKADIEFLLNHSKARAVICLPAFKEFPTAEVMLGIKDGGAALENIIVAGPEAPDGAVTLDSLMTEGGPMIGNPPVGSDPFLLLYTSGTTSSPKGAPLTYQNMVGHGRLCAPEFGVTAEDRILSAAPFSHLYGLYNYYVSLAVGAAQVLLPAFAPPDLAQLTKVAKPTAIFMGPAHVAALDGMGLLEKHDFSSVRFTVFSGSYCPPDLLRTYHAKTGSAVCQLWGMTELASGTFSRPDQGLEVGATTAGPAAPGNEIRVVSSETGDALPADTEGELQVRGASVFPGYLDNLEANTDAFAGEGWFRTGDLAVIDGDGHLKITGRTKDIINRGGVKYNPADIEELLFTHPSIELAAIVPVPDPVLGEKACCFVQLKPDQSLTLGQVTAFLEQKNVSKNKWPERLEMVDEMPLTPTRKIIKGRLAERLDG